MTLMRFHVVTSLLLLTLSAVTAAAPLRLADNGVSEYQIVSPPKPSAVDAYAMELLARSLKESTGADFAVVEAVTPGRPSIILGGATETPGPQEYVVRADGRNILLYGEGLHGNLNAVTAFLEHAVAMRWFSPRSGPVVPKHRVLDVEPMDIRRGFDFTYRNLAWRHRHDYKYFHGINMGLRESEKSPAFINARPCDRWTHTFFMYIPPKADHPEAADFGFLDHRDWFTTNPEFFSMDAAGRRVPSMQLCFSNAGLRQQFTANILKRIERDGENNIIAVVAADTPGRFCFCEPCKALEAKYQSPGGPLYDYLFELCGRLKVEHPATMIHTLAYRRAQTQIPPTMPAGTAFPDNLIIDFAPIEDCYFADWTHPDPSVQETYAHLKAWRSLTPRLWAWLYPNPWGSGTYMPVGKISRMVTNIRLMRDAGVEGFFADHQGINQRSSFAELQGYLMCKLTQDADADSDVLITEFTDNHYGAAGALMRQYLGELEQGRLAMTELPRDVTYKSRNYDDRTFPYLTAANIHRWQGWFDQMEELTAADSLARGHVRIARRELDMATLWKWFDLKAAHPDQYADHTRVTARIRAADAIVPPDGTQVLPLGGSVMSDFTVVIEAGGQVKPLPAQFAAIDPTHIKQLLPRNHARTGVRTVIDPDAAFGYAVTVDKPDLPLQVGFYQWLSQNPPKGIEGPRIRLSLGELPPGRYQLHHLGTITVTEDSWIWFSAKSWATHLEVGTRVYEPGEANQWDAWVSMKCDGPTYGGTAADDVVLVDRIILVPAEHAAAVIGAAPPPPTVPAPTPQASSQPSSQHTGDNLLIGGDAEKVHVTAGWVGNLRRHTDDFHGGAASLAIANSASMGWSPTFIEIDPAKTYRLSGWMKSTNPNKLGRAMIDCRFMDESREDIEPWTVRPISSIGAVAVAAAKGDKIVYVKATDWPAYSDLLSLALDVKPDFSDLPSRLCHRMTGLSLSDGRYRVTLRTPLEQDVPAGMSARVNRYVDHPRAVLESVPADWTFASVTIKPRIGLGPAKPDTIWPQAKFVKVAVLAFDVKEGESAVLFDDIVLAEVLP